MVQQLRLHFHYSGHRLDPCPGWGTKSLQATGCGQTKKKNRTKNILPTPTAEEEEEQLYCWECAIISHSGKQSAAFYKVKRTTQKVHSWEFTVSRVGEGNGNPLQCSCLENPRDGGAWWVAVYGVAQSRTRLKRFRTSSTSKTLT